MNSILSLLVCLAMLLSGGSYSETPEAASSRVMTLSDVVVTIDGTEYALNPSASIGVRTENNTALLDVAVNSGEDVLFPIQAKIDEAGATVLISDASTAYTFTPELMGLTEMPEATTAILDTVMRMISDIPNLKAGEAAMTEAAVAVLTEAAADAVTAETTYTVDGEEVPATHSMYTIDHEEFMACYDAMIGAYEGEFYDAYFELLNYFLALSSADLDNAGIAVAEITKFSDLFTLVPMTISIDCEETVTADGLGEMDWVMQFAMEAEGETVSFEVPMHFTFYGAETMEMAIDLTLPEDAGAIYVAAGVDGSNSIVTMAMEVVEAGETVSTNMSMTATEQENGFTEQYVYFDMADGSVSMAYEVSSLMDAQGLGDAVVAIGFEDVGAQYGASFSMNVSDAEITDRIAGATVQTLATEEEIEESNGLMLSVMGLASDVEKLTSEPSIVALVDAVNALMPVVEDPALVVDSEVYTYEETEAAEDASDDPSELSFDVPAFNIPEGYELTDQYVDAEYGWASFTYEASADDSYSSIYIDLFESAEGYEDYVMTADGALTAAEGLVFSIYQEEGYMTATTNIDGVQCSVTCYSDAFTLEDLAALMSGI